MNENDIGPNPKFIDNNERLNRKKRKVPCPLCGIKKSRNNLSRHLKKIHKKLNADSINQILESLKFKRTIDLSFDAMVKAEITKATHEGSQIIQIEGKSELQNALPSSILAQNANDHEIKRKILCQNEAEIQFCLESSSDPVISESAKYIKTHDKTYEYEFGLAPTAVMIMNEARKQGNSLSIEE